MLKAIEGLVCMSIILSRSAFALPPDLREIRQQARQLLQQKSCTGCHTPGLFTSQQRALDIYDLSKESWISSIQDLKLDSLITRAKQGTGSLLEKSKPDAFEARSLPFSQREIELISKVVKMEKDYRRENPVDFLKEHLSSKK